MVLNRIRFPAKAACRTIVYQMLRRIGLKNSLTHLTDSSPKLYKGPPIASAAPSFRIAAIHLKSKTNLMIVITKLSTVPTTQLQERVVKNLQLFLYRKEVEIEPFNKG